MAVMELKLVFFLALINSLISFVFSATVGNNVPTLRPNEDTNVAIKRRDPTLPFGTVIQSCTEPGTVALTFDDGPFAYTANLLDQLQDADMAATFFVNGLNWADIFSDESQANVRRMLAEGHQIASHTYYHPDLSTLEKDAIISDMTQLEDALVDIVGRSPTYMRPPYFGATETTFEILGNMGYHIIYADIDTHDFEHQTPESSGNSIQKFKDGLDGGGTITLAHDVHQTTVEILAPAMIEEIQARGLRAVTVGECLGDPEENWYRN